MGMPVITPGTGTRAQAITDLIQSAALQETALSHILNAEGENMQAFIAAPDITPAQLMALNGSVNRILNSLTRLELMLQTKLELFSNGEPQIEDPQTGGPPTDDPPTDDPPTDDPPTDDPPTDDPPTDDPPTDDPPTDDPPTDGPPTNTAATELTNIQVLTVTIDLPLDDPAAQQAAVAQAIVIAQAQVSPGYTATFNSTAYVPGLLAGTFTVTGNADPADTRTDAAPRAILVLTTAISPATTAAIELNNINVTTVTIDIPLDDPAAAGAATAQAIAAAQAQVAQAPITQAATVQIQAAATRTHVSATQTHVSATQTQAAATQTQGADPLTAQALGDMGYTVTFTMATYVPGLLVGTFTVTGDADPADTKTDTALRAIIVLTTFSVATTLAKIHVPSVIIDILLQDPNAQAAAAAQAIAAAQAQIPVGYTVTFTPTGYTYGASAGTLNGTFTMSKDADPSDTASDTATQIIAVTTTAVITAATSHAYAAFFSGNLQGGATPVAIAHYENGVTPDTSITQTIKLEPSAAEQANMFTNPFNGVSVPLSDFLQIGAINQYAEASADAVSRAFCGSVSDSGVVTPDGSEDFPADLKIDLAKLLPANETLSTAVISFGAITAAAAWDAKFGRMRIATTDIANPNLGFAYNIAGATLDLAFPAFSSFLSEIGSTFVSLDSIAETMSDTFTAGLESGIANAMGTINSVLPASQLSLVSDNLTASVDSNLAAAATAILATPILSPDGAATLVPAAGTVHVDLAQLYGGSLNNLPYNTSLLGPSLLSSILYTIHTAATALQTQLNGLMDDVLADAAATASGHVVLLQGPGDEAAGMDLSYSGTLEGEAAGIALTGTGQLTDLLAPAIHTVTGTIHDAVLQSLTETRDATMLPNARTRLSNAVSALDSALAPLTTLITSELELIVNIIETSGAYSQTPIRLYFSRYGIGLNLGRVSVGENTYTL